MADWDSIRRFAVLTLIVIAILASAAALIDWAGFEALVSLMASIAGILALAVVLSDQLNQSEDGDGKASTGERSAIQRISPIGDTGGVRSIEEHIEMIKGNPEWRFGGKHNFSNRTVAAGRFFQRLLNRLGISKRNRIWAHRIAMGVAAMAYLWIAMLLGRILHESPLVELPATLEAIVYAIPLQFIHSQPVSLLLYFGIPAFITIAYVWAGVSRSESTCLECEMPFALGNEGCYYKSGDRTKRTEERDGNTYTWYEIDGIQILRCTREECGKPQIYETRWTESDRGFFDSF